MNFEGKGPREVNGANIIPLRGRRKKRRVKRTREESRANNDIIGVVVGTTGLDLEYTEAVGADRLRSEHVDTMNQEEENDTRSMAANIREGGWMIHQRR